jgi:hypothetical protein
MQCFSQHASENFRLTANQFSSEYLLKAKRQVRFTFLEESQSETREGLLLPSSPVFSFELRHHEILMRVAASE